MTVLFKEGIPAQDTPIRSVEIRDNFDSLYSKLKTLEPRATSPESTQILVNGGPVYFRASTSVLYNAQGEPISGAQRLIVFQTSIIDLATSNGFKTIKNTDGTLSKEAVSGGISPFATDQAGYFREILITLNNQGRLSFVEGATTTTGLSRSFDIAFDDSEIPICLVIIQHSGALLQSGQLAPIRQIDITDVRPIITTAFQNNLTSAALESNVLDNRLRLDALERSSLTNDALKVQIPPPEKLILDNARTTNKTLEILSGSAYINNTRVDYPGGKINVTQNLTTPLPTDNFAVACVALLSDGTIYVYHGSAADSSADAVNVKLPYAVRSPYGGLQAPTDAIPLALIYYRMSSSSDAGTPGYTTQIDPVVSDVFVRPTFDSNSNLTGGTRLAFEFSIVSIIDASTFVVQLPSDISITPPSGETPAQIVPNVFQSGQTIEIFDDNTRSFRRVISNNPQGPGSLDITARTMQVIVSEAFVNDVTFATPAPTFRGISLKRNPKARIVDQKPGVVLQDVRPFIMEL